MKRIALLLLLGASLSGCPGQLEDISLYDGTGPDYCITVTEMMFARSCATSQCHDAGVAEADLDLESKGVAERLIGKPADDPACSGVLVDPLEPEASVLYQKMLPNPPCGDRMPLFARPASQVQLDCLLEWIARQAPEGGEDAGDETTE